MEDKQSEMARAIISKTNAKITERELIILIIEEISSVNPSSESLLHT